MKMFTLFINKKFASGNLKGISIEEKIAYPVSSRERVEEFMREAVKKKTVFKDFGSGTFLYTGYSIK